MITEEPLKSEVRHSYRFWLLTCLLFIIAVALRWVRIDLMTFRYDQASVAIRSLEIFRSGPPLTGIVNSLGFHNAPGYIWSVLPAFLLTPDPRIAAAWHGLIASTMVFPLALLGSRYRSDSIKWFPAILAAVLPASVFAGRNLWAQCLLPPVTCWALFFLDGALCGTRTDIRRARAAAACLALLAWGISIHFSAASLFLLAVVILTVGYKSQWRKLVLAILPAVLIQLTLIPSGLDWWDHWQNPAPKPDFAVAFESVLPDPLPWHVRVPDSVTASVSNSSIEALLGIETIMQKPAVLCVRIFDYMILAIVLISGAFAVASLLKHRGIGTRSERHKFITILMAWIVVPAVLGGLLVDRVNAGYFFGSLPAGWLLPLALPGIRAGMAAIARSMAALALAGGIMITVLFLSVINREGFVPGGYYITYREQAAVVQYMNEQGIDRGDFLHLAGDWFQRSYGYIQQYVLKPDEIPSVDPVGVARYALMEDRITIPGQEAKIQFFWGRNPKEFGNVGVLIFPSRGAAEIFARDYYARRK